MAKKKTQDGTPIKARITVYPRPEILDPQGKAIAAALTRLGFEGVDDVRAGKSFEVLLSDVAGDKVEDTLKEMCEGLLVNSVVEDYAIELLSDEAAP